LAGLETHAEVLYRISDRLEEVGFGDWRQESAKFCGHKIDKIIVDAAGSKL
jgi:hypothetical protein